VTAADAACPRLEPVPLEDYAVLGDGRTVALVASDGQIDWFATPVLDAEPVFAGLLNPAEGGTIGIRPTAPFESRRRYLPNTNIVETTFTTDSGVARLTDALTVGTSGPLPWNELVRLVEILSGEVDLLWWVSPGDLTGSAGPWTRKLGDRVTLHCGSQVLGVRAYDFGPMTIDPHAVRGRVLLCQGETATLGVTGSDAGQVWLPDRGSMLARLNRTRDRWVDWASQIHYEGRWRDAVIRSALALKLLVHEPTGAIAAAGTTSLPESIGGQANWDYRYMWVRDTAYAADALMRLGLGEETHAVVSWLLHAVRESAPDLRVMYTLDGAPAQPGAEIDAPGYRNSRPVRRGNDAVGQRQLGTYGDLFDTIWTYVRNDHVLDVRTGNTLAAYADQCCDTWRHTDSGLWELSDQRHYTVSKMGCWIALDRAIKLHNAEQVATTHVGRWVAERDAIKQWVDTHCWSNERRSYTFYAGTDDLDAAVLLAGQVGFDRGERLASTIAAIGSELVEGPLVWRYSGTREREGAFVACTFWMVNALHHTDQRDRAEGLMEAAVGLANDVGLFSEEIAADRSFLGNLPQALSHLALINAATSLSEQAESGERPAANSDVRADGSPTSISRSEPCPS